MNQIGIPDIPVDIKERIEYLKKTSTALRNAIEVFKDLLINQSEIKEESEIELAVQDLLNITKSIYIKEDKFPNSEENPEKLFHHDLEFFISCLDILCEHGTENILVLSVMPVNKLYDRIYTIYSVCYEYNNKYLFDL